MNAKGNDIAKFLAELSSIQLKIVQMPEEVCRNAAIELLDRIVESSPVDITDPDTVSLIGDFVSGAGSVPSEAKRSDPSGEASKADVREAAKAWKPLSGETFYIAHHSEYLPLLEYGLYSHDPKSGRTTPEGFSVQAPNGFLGIHVVEWPDIIRQESAKLGVK